MSLPEKLFEKAFYWGPLFVGIISLVVGLSLVRAVGNVQGEVPLAKLQLTGAETSSHLMAHTKARKPVQNKHQSETLSKTVDTATLSPLSPAQETPQDKSRALRSDLSETAAANLIAPGDTDRGLEGSKKTVIHKPVPQKLTDSEEVVRDSKSEALSLHDNAIGHDKAIRHDKAIGHGKTVGAGAVLALSGFQKTGLQSGQIGIQYSASKLAQGGRLSELGLKRTLHHSNHISVMAKAGALAGTFGDQGQTAIQGFATLKTRAKQPLIAHYSETFGKNVLGSFKGVTRSLLHSSQLPRQFLLQNGDQLGGNSAQVHRGFNLTMRGSETLLKEFKIAKVATSLNHEVALKSYKGAKNLATQSEKMKLTTLGLATSGDLTLDNNKTTDDSLTKPPCSERFYDALQELRTTKISTIRTAAKPLSKSDKALPGKWIFSPPAFKTRRVCNKYRYRKARRKKCIKWGTSKPVATAFTDEEKNYILTAQKLILGRGRHPLVKPRSSGHWVINIVAQNLNSYTSQKPHPALCTGALGMLDYFEGNLKRIKAHMAEIATLNEQSKTHISQQVSRLNASFRNRSALRNVGVSLDSVTQNQEIIIRSYDPLTVNGQAVAALFGEDVGLEILSRETFIQALKLTRTLLKAKKPHLRAQSYTAFMNLATILEASFYIQKTHEKYIALEQNLFGSLDGIREAHSTHCNCPN